MTDSLSPKLLLSIWENSLFIIRMPLKVGAFDTTYSENRPILSRQGQE
jgi:hypothetical protein